MGKFPEKISFRTSEESAEYLKKLADSDERSISFVLNKMIAYFKNNAKVKNVRNIK